MFDACEHGHGAQSRHRHASEPSSYYISPMGLNDWHSNGAPAVTSNHCPRPGGQVTTSTVLWPMLRPRPRCLNRSRLASITSNKPLKKIQFWSALLPYHLSQPYLLVPWANNHVASCSYIQGFVNKRNTLHQILYQIQTYQASGREDSRQPFKCHFRRRLMYKKGCKVWRISKSKAAWNPYRSIPELGTDPAARRHCSLTTWRLCHLQESTKRPLIGLIGLIGGSYCSCLKDWVYNPWGSG